MSWGHQGKIRKGERLENSIGNSSKSVSAANSGNSGNSGSGSVSVSGATADAVDSNGEKTTEMAETTTETADRRPKLESVK